MRYEVSTSGFDCLSCLFLVVSLISFCSLSNKFGRGIMKIKESDFLMIRKGLKCNKHSKKLLFTLKQIIKQIL